MQLAELKGSPKQIKWAEDIRNDFLKDYDKLQYLATTTIFKEDRII